MNTTFTTSRESKTPTSINTHWKHEEEGKLVEIAVRIGMRSTTPAAAVLELHTLQTAVDLLQERIGVLKQELS